ncbi:ABC transporter ATP-binding protein/permease [Kribbella sp. NBC_00482]|uniref:ABC transporter ATP-binding protein n=1 Tax=Kribbella sp. NBC_00482 TaxID=2975968 RepID=UPI002E19F3CC
MRKALAPFRDAPARIALIRVVWNSSRLLTATAALAILVSAGLGTGGAVISGHLIGAAADVGPGTSLRDPFYTLLVGSLVVIIASTVLQQINEYVVLRLGLRTELRMRRFVLEASVRPAGVAHVESAAGNDLVAIAGGVGPASQNTPAKAAAGLFAVASRWATSLGAAGVVSFYWWWAGPVLLASWMALAATSRKIRLEVLKLWTGHSSELRRADYLRDLAISPAAAKELRIFGFAPWLISRHWQLWLQSMQVVWKHRHRSVGRLVPPLLVVILIHAVVFATLGSEALNGSASVADVGTVVFAILNINAITAWTDDDVNLEYGSRAVQAAASWSDATSSDVPESPVMPRLTSAIVFDGVWFRYPGTERWICRDLHLVIPVGVSTAVVGLNGAGKTTIVKLLLGMYRPDRGVITADGIDISTFEPAEWRHLIAPVFQDFLRLERSLRDNITMGAGSSGDDEDKAIMNAAEAAGATDVINSVPHGLDTIASTAFTGGTDLSGGQWQRLAIARAVYAIDHGAELAILDEPTAHLDVRAEEAVFAQYLQLMSAKTAILISHRLSAVRRAARIIVLEHGQVLECGTHEELMAAGSRYAELYSLQRDRLLAGVDLGDG